MSKTHSMTRDQWIAEVAQIWATKHGDKQPNKNIKDYAASMADAYYDEQPGEYSPMQAVDEELSCA